MDASSKSKIERWVQITSSLLCFTFEQIELGNALISTFSSKSCFKERVRFGCLALDGKHLKERNTLNFKRWIKQLSFPRSIGNSQIITKQKLWIAMIAYILNWDDTVAFLTFPCSINSHKRTTHRLQKVKNNVHTSFYSDEKRTLMLHHDKIALWTQWNLRKKLWS